MENINENSIRLRGRKILLEYKIDISCNELLKFLESCLKEIPEKWKYFIIKERYNEKDVSVFAFIEFNTKVDYYFKFQLDENRVQGFYQTGLDRDIVLKYLLKSFKSGESSTDNCYLTNFPSNEVDLNKRIVTLDKKSNENSLLEELPLNDGEKSPTLKREGGKKPNSKQLKRIYEKIEFCKTERNKDKPDEVAIRKATTALRNYYYDKKLSLGDELNKILENLLLRNKNKKET